MKNLKKLSRQGLKKFSGGKALDPISDIGTGGGCDPGHGCTCGAIYNNFTPGNAHWDCCQCPRQGF